MYTTNETIRYILLNFSYSPKGTLSYFVLRKVIAFVIIKEQCNETISVDAIIVKVNQMPILQRLIKTCTQLLIYYNMYYSLCFSLSLSLSSPFPHHSLSRS